MRPVWAWDVTLWVSWVSLSVVQSGLGVNFLGCPPLGWLATVLNIFELWIIFLTVDWWTFRLFGNGLINLCWLIIASLRSLLMFFSCLWISNIVPPLSLDFSSLGLWWARLPVSDQSVKSVWRLDACSLFPGFLEPHSLLAPLYITHCVLTLNKQATMISLVLPWVLLALKTTNRVISCFSVKGVLLASRKNKWICL